MLATLPALGFIVIAGCNAAATPHPEPECLTTLGAKVVFRNGISEQLVAVSRGALKEGNIWFPDGRLATQSEVATLLRQFRLVDQKGHECCRKPLKSFAAQPACVTCWVHTSNVREDSQDIKFAIDSPTQVWLNRTQFDDDAGHIEPTKGEYFDLYRFTAPPTGKATADLKIEFSHGHYRIIPVADLNPDRLIKQAHNLFQITVNVAPAGVNKNLIIRAYNSVGEPISYASLLRKLPSPKGVLNCEFMVATDARNDVESLAILARNRQLATFRGIPLKPAAKSSLTPKSFSR